MIETQMWNEAVIEKRLFGRTGMRVSVLGFGGGEIGHENVSLEIVERLLGSALDAGLNVIDTAECYATSEELIGKAVAHRRNEFYLFTKCGHGDDGYMPAWEPPQMMQSIERSLRRLRTDHLDLLQLHSCSEELLRRGDVIDILQRTRDAGKTRYIGYSGDQQAALYAVNCGAFDTLQTSLNIADQEAIDLTLPLAREREMGVIAKRPVANVAWKGGAKQADSYQYVYRERLNKLDYDFLKEDFSKAMSTALRFTLSVPGVHTAIVGTTRPQHWQENVASLAAGMISEEQFEAIRRRWRETAEADWRGDT